MSNRKEVTPELRHKNNPNGEPVGHYTGRCYYCHSDDLWDDNLAYGCNCCGAFLNSNEFRGFGPVIGGAK